MPTEKKCPDCGAAIPAGAPPGFCPRCELAGAQELTPPGSPAVVVTEQPGDHIGRYKLLEKIGEGGYGIVYMAEQSEPIRRRVALKVVKLGMDTKQVIARFEAERQALALMNHPNIAKVLDAGSTDAGRPYFVMELVRGVRITDYCDENHLSTRDRIDLFLQVCQAVQHAHQKGIIHRDLKPSNILVTTLDGSPVPKVIDFGIAKATQQPLTEKTLFTSFQQFIGTPAYMSPEQAEMSGLDIDPGASPSCRSRTMQPPPERGWPHPQCHADIRLVRRTTSITVLGLRTRPSALHRQLGDARTLAPQQRQDLTWVQRVSKFKDC